MENSQNNIPEHLQSLINQLKNYPTLVVRPSKRNKVDIVQIMRTLPTEVIKLIFTNIDKKTGEDAILLHNKQKTHE